MTSNSFSDLKVIEFAGVLAGPSVGMFFAELGATVVKIENPRTGGDVTRSWKLAGEDPDFPFSAYYAAVNWNKEALFLDLKTEEGKKRAQELAAGADVVITNYKTGDAEKLGLDAPSLHRANPRLVHASISGFGPADRRGAFDLVLQAESGYMSMNGEAGGEPLKMPVALIDILAAHQLKEGILVALLQREKTGRGASVSVSLFDAALASLANQASNYLMTGRVPQRIGSLHPNIAPYGETFTCADGKQIVLAVGNDRQFTALAGLLGRPELASDPQFSTNAARVKNRASLMEFIRYDFAAEPADAAVKRLEAAGIPAGRVRDLAEVFELPRAQALILRDKLGGQDAARVRSAVFSLRPAGEKE